MDFVDEYQYVKVLTIGERWAVAISLRLILVKNLRRVSQRMVESRKARDAADGIAEEVLTLNRSESTIADIFKRIREPIWVDPARRLQRFCPVRWKQRQMR